MFVKVEMYDSVGDFLACSIYEGKQIFVNRERICIDTGRDITEVGLRLDPTSETKLLKIYLLNDNGKTIDRYRSDWLASKEERRATGSLAAVA